MKYNYCLILQYDGTRYNGWQRQGNTGSTIQGLLEDKLSSILGEVIDLKGSGRTDRGVHAAGQVANFYAKKEVLPDNLRTRLNQELPEDIRVNRITMKPADFHSRKSAKKKTYEYCIWNSAERNVFYRNYAYQVEEPLDIDKMRLAAQKLIGTYDFIGFSSCKESKKSTVRTIFDIEITKVKERIYIRYTGDGFLYHMVRILTGTLIEVGKGNKKPEAVVKVMEDKKRSDAGPTVPAEGLKLLEVFYARQSNIL